MRNGHAPERQLQTGIGPIAVRRPKVRDRGPDGSGADPVHLGGAAGLSAADEERRGAVALALPEGHLDRAVRGGLGSVARRRRAWPVGDDRATPDGRLAGRARALADSATSRPGAMSISGPTASTSRRGSSMIGSASWSSSAPTPRAARSCWRSRMVSGRAPRAGASCCSGCATRTASCSTPSSPPAMAALGFWQALHEVWPKTRQQRCWVHKTANVLNKLPPSLHGKAKHDLHAIYEAESRLQPRRRSITSSPSTVPSTTRRSTA